MIESNPQNPNTISNTSQKPVTNPVQPKMQAQTQLKSEKPMAKPKSKKKSQKKGLIVLLVLILVAVCSGIFSFLNLSKTTLNSSEKIQVSPSGKSSDISNDIFSKIKNIKHQSGYIAVLYIDGIIEEKNKTYNQEWLLETIIDLKYDKNNKAILLYIDSPGGAVFQADEAYLALQDYKTSGKPIWAYMGSLAASGGYYIACAATDIHANRNTLTGSIGVLAGQSIDATEFLEKIGIKSTTIHAGKNKNMMNFNEVFSEEQQAIMQSIADDAYDQFTKIVANSRNMSLEEVQELADGRIYTARQALENGLIDGIGSFESVVEEFRTEKLNNKELKIEHFKTTEKDSIYDYLMGSKTLLTGILTFLKTGSIQQALSQSHLTMQYPAYYYPL